MYVCNACEGKRREWVDETRESRAGGETYAPVSPVTVESDVNLLVHRVQRYRTLYTLGTRWQEALGSVQEINYLTAEQQRGPPDPPIRYKSIVAKPRCNRRNQILIKPTGMRHVQL